jgi:hypothetical protein
VALTEGCKKNNTSTPPVPTTKCLIKTEATTLSGNEKSFEYSFDDNGNPSLVKVFNRFGNLDKTYEIGSNTVKINYTVGNKAAFTLIKYLDNDIFDDKLPARADVSISDGDTTKVNYYSYFFFYNTKNQLIKVGEQTNFVIGDWEYDVNIYYNDQGNVKGLQYVYTTGPNQALPPTTVSAYDDKPTPFAGMKGWPFLMVNFAWDNYDPEPLLTALSKNNPLNYSTGTGANLFTRTMAYEYNNDGFPTLRKNTNKNVNGEYTFLQTFSYNCK